MEVQKASKNSSVIITILIVGMLKFICGVAIYCIYDFTGAWNRVTSILEAAVVMDATTLFIGQPLLATSLIISCLIIRKSNEEKAKSDIPLAVSGVLIWVVSAVVWCSAVKLIF